MKTQGPLFINKNFKMVTVEQVHRPSKRETLCDSTNHTPVELALGRYKDERVRSSHSYELENNFISFIGYSTSKLIKAVSKWHISRKSLEVIV